MTTQFKRRALLAMAGTAAAGVALGSGVAIAGETQAPATEPIPTTPEEAVKQIAKVYLQESVRARGLWNSFVTVTDSAGALLPAVDDKPDELVDGLSVNKIAVAMTVLDKVDLGLLQPDADRRCDPGHRRRGR